MTEPTSHRYALVPIDVLQMAANHIGVVADSIRERDNAHEIAGATDAAILSHQLAEDLAAAARGEHTPMVYLVPANDDTGPDEAWLFTDEDDATAFAQTYADHGAGPIVRHEPIITHEKAYELLAERQQHLANVDD